jgi:hypothetical protein
MREQRAKLSRGNDVAKAMDYLLKRWAAFTRFLAVTLAYLGYIDQARLRLNEALSEARRLRHAYTVHGALLFATWTESVTRRRQVATWT